MAFLVQAGFRNGCSSPSTSSAQSLLIRSGLMRLLSARLFTLH